MMRRLLEAYGADYEQWRALTRVGVKLDLRSKSLGQAKPRRKGRARLDLPPGVLTYLALGLLLASMVLTSPDLFLATLVIITYAMFMTATTVLLEYHTVVTAPDDYFILGYQPISSRTYFAARITNLLIFVLFTSTLFSAAPALTALFRGGLRPEIGITLFAGVSLGSMSVALLVVLLYAWLVQRVNAKRLQRVLTYLQLVVSMIVYGGYFIVPRMLLHTPAGMQQLHSSWALLLFPPFWFASYMDLVLGRASGPVIVAALVAPAFGWLIARAAAGRISLDFAERLSDVSVAVSPATAQGARRDYKWGVAQGEARAVWLLVRAQFRSDNKFRMGVLAILPLTVLYVAMALMGGGVVDPFANDLQRLGGDSPIYMAVVLFPILMITSITSSDQYQASWVFFATPADRYATLLAMRRAVLRAFVLPYLALIGLVFAFFFHSLLHALTHIVLLGLICNLALLLLLLINPRLPFAHPRVKGERSKGLFGVAILAAIAGSAAIPLLAHFVYISAGRTAGVLLGLWLLGFLLERLGRVRVRRQTLESEFLG